MAGLFFMQTQSYTFRENCRGACPAVKPEGL